MRINEVNKFNRIAITMSDIRIEFNEDYETIKKYSSHSNKEKELI